MAEIKEFKPTTKEYPKPEKPADIVDFSQDQKENIPVADDQETKQLLKTLSHLIQRLFDESNNKKEVINQLRGLADDLEKKLKK